MKGTKFKGLRDVGDPVELAARYEAEGADEIVYLDISASKEERGTLLDTVRRTAERLFIPLTVGGRRAHGRGHRAAAAGRGRQDQREQRRRAGPCAPHPGRRALRQPVRGGEHRRRPRRAAASAATPTAAPSPPAWTRWRGRRECSGAGRRRDPPHLHRPGRRTHRLRPGAHPGGGRRGAGPGDRVGGRRGLPSTCATPSWKATPRRSWWPGILHDGLTTVAALKRALAGWGVNVRDDPGSRGMTDRKLRQRRRSPVPAIRRARAGARDRAGRPGRQGPHGGVGERARAGADAGHRRDALLVPLAR